MSKPLAGCSEFRQHLLSRRGILQAGMLGMTGISLADVLRADAQAAAAGRKTNKLNSVMILWMRGGPSQIDTWDPKPEGPVEIRGEFAPISTNVPGIQLSEHLPRSAKMMDKWSIIRSMHHPDGQASHSSGDQICFTGYPGAQGAFDRNVNPSCGSVAMKQLQHLNPELPAYAVIPRHIPGTGSGYLGNAYMGFQTGLDDPALPGPFKVPTFEPVEGINIERLGDRRALLNELDRLRRDVDRNGEVSSLDQFQRQAWDVLGSTKAREAFDLEKEPASMFDRYGRLEKFTARTMTGGDCPAWSRRILLGRRLIEAGIRLVTVDVRWWDTHSDNFYSLKEGFLPRWDQAYTALLTDLEERGLLDSTLIVAWGEIGRTPRISPDAGRDHWPNSMSVAMAGGGVKGGRVVGSTDRTGGRPKDNPKTPQDVLATIYRHLGIDYNINYINQAGRPMPVLPSGSPINELF